MKNTKYFITSLIFFTIITSCSSTYIHQPTLLKGYPRLKINETSTAIIIGDDDIKILDFIKTFNKKYAQSNDFVNEYIDALSETLISKKVFSKIYSDKSTRPDKTSQSSFLLQKEDSLFNKTHADYIIRITQIELSSTTVYEMLNTPTRGKICRFNIHFQIFETKSQRKVMEFVSKEYSGSSPFAQIKGIKRAVTNSIYHATEYLKNGRTKFTH